MTPEQKNLLRAVALALLVGLAVYFVVIDATTGGRRGGGLVGKSAPAFKLPALEGGEAVALEGLRGKGVMVAFWATSCPACRDELPVLDQIHRELAGDDLAVLTIAAEARGSLSAFVKKRGYELPVLVDPGSVHMNYEVGGIPRTLFIGPDGTVLFDSVGPVSPSGLVDAANRLAACAKAQREGKPSDPWCTAGAGAGGAS